MKVYLADNPYFKTTQIFIDHLKADGHEVVTDPYFNPLKAEWADVIWVEWCEGTSVQASQRSGHHEGVISDHKQISQTDFDWSKSRLIVRPIDIDVYYGHFRQVQWEQVDVLTYIAQHIYERMDREMEFSTRFANLTTKHVPLGIEVDKWNFKKRDGNGRNIAWMNHTWTAKNLQLAVLGMRALIDKTGDDRWMLHVVSSRWSNENWYKPFIEYQIKTLNLQDNVKLMERVPDVDIFLDDMDFWLNTSMKEAFSLPTAESMAKGIKPIIYDWEGSRDIYPQEHIYRTVDEMVELFTAPYESDKYREQVQKYDFASNIYPQMVSIIKA